MRKIFKAIRKIKPINKSLSFFFRGISNAVDKVITHWPVFGVTQVKFDKIDFKMYSGGDDHIVNLLYYKKGYHEQKDLHFFLELVKKSNTIFDIGANTGIYTILSGKVNSAATIYSFEPNPVNIIRLKKNIQLNGTHNELVEKALGDSPATISFAVPSDDSISDTSSASIEFSKSTYNGKIKWKSIDVKQTTLDSFTDEKNIKEVDLMKIDVEGYEESVFKGGALFFKKFSPVIQCEILLDERRKIFFESFVRENGYTAYLILNDGLLRIDSEMQYNPGSLNYLFAKNKTVSQFTSFNEIEKLSHELTRK